MLNVPEVDRSAQGPVTTEASCNVAPAAHVSARAFPLTPPVRTGAGVASSHATAGARCQQEEKAVLATRSWIFLGMHMFGGSVCLEGRNRDCLPGRFHAF